jgi:hypothetical protein
MDRDLIDSQSSCAPSHPLASDGVTPFPPCRPSGDASATIRADPLLQGRMAELKAVHDTSRSGSHFASCEKIEKRIDKRHITMQSGML